MNTHDFPCFREQLSGLSSCRLSQASRYQALAILPYIHTTSQQPVFVSRRNSITVFPQRQDECKACTWYWLWSVITKVFPYSTNYALSTTAHDTLLPATQRLPCFKKLQKRSTLTEPLEKLAVGYCSLKLYSCLGYFDNSYLGLCRVLNVWIQELTIVFRTLRHLGLPSWSVLTHLVLDFDGPEVSFPRKFIKRVRGRYMRTIRGQTRMSTIYIHYKELQYTMQRGL